MPAMTTLAHRIRQARRARNMTQAQLAAAMGVSRPAASQWESRTSPSAPETHRIERIAEVLGVSADWLLTGKGEMIPDIEGAPIPGGALDRNLLYRVTVALESHLVAEGMELDPVDKGETLLAVYDWAEAEGAPEIIDIRRISSLLRRLSKPRRRALAHP